MSFLDHFSAVAASYAAFRPRYPDALVDRLTRGIARDTAWDVGCGSGQLSTALAAHFQRVIATDPSSAQLAEAAPHPRVEYRCERAEHSTLRGGSVDLAVAAQAAHWFDWPAFAAEVARVTRAGSRIALIGYGDCILDGGEPPAVTAYRAAVEAYWPPQRVLIDHAYRDLVLPFDAEDVPPMVLEVTWTRDQLVGYFASWSATSRYRAAHGDAAFETLVRDAAAQWPGDERRTVRWPIIAKLYRR